jgi:dTMP kinase
MFITLEGIEGSGKSTQIPAIVNHLESKGYKCVVTREPGGTAVGGQIRAVLLNPENKAMDPMAELMLYEADRAQHVSEVIRPSLKSGNIVICDRFCDSTVVYQGAARGIAPEVIERLNKLVLGEIEPDITFLLDLSPEKGLRRAWQQIENGCRHENETRFEKETLRFHEKVRQGYLALAKKNPMRFKVIDADLSRHEVGFAIIGCLDSVLS